RPELPDWAQPRKRTPPQGVSGTAPPQGKPAPSPGPSGTQRSESVGNPVDDYDAIAELLTRKNRTWGQALQWLPPATPPQSRDPLKWKNSPAEHRQLLVDAVSGALAKQAG